jgi:hypothetical protein
MVGTNPATAGDTNLTVENWSYRCPHCTTRLEVVRVKFRLASVAVVSGCPSCMIIIADERHTPKGVSGTRKPPNLVRLARSVLAMMEALNSRVRYAPCVFDCGVDYRGLVAPCGTCLRRHLPRRNSRGRTVGHFCCFTRAISICEKALALSGICGLPAARISAAPKLRAVSSQWRRTRAGKQCFVLRQRRPKIAAFSFSMTKARTSAHQGQLATGSSVSLHHFDSDRSDARQNRTPAQSMNVLTAARTVHVRVWRGAAGPAPRYRF